MLRRTLPLFVLLAAAVSLPASGQKALEVPYTRFQLDNGLDVVLHADTSAPVVSTNIWYHVGSGDEEPGRTGFAHLFEHLMFEGSRNVPEGKIDEWLQAYGGSPNGSTTSDRTNYMQTVAANALELTLFIEADRMGTLLDAAGPEVVDKQRDVVKNERRQRVENAPYGGAMIALEEHLYPAGHPYHWPTIGYMEDLSAATYDDVARFYRTWYTPANASLVIAGDINLDETRQLVEKWFGPLPTLPPPPARATPPPVRPEETRLVMEDRVQLPRLYMMWAAPPAYAPGTAALNMAADLLGRGKNSRLYSRLVYDLQIAQDVSVFAMPGRFGSAFLVVATARSGVELGRIESVLREEIARLAAAPPEPDEMERALARLETAFFRGLERVSDKADDLNSYLFYTGNPDYFNEDLASYRALSASDLSAVVATYVKGSAPVVLSVVPMGQPEVAAPESGAVSMNDPKPETSR